jgi:hypothetical protein
MRRRYVIEHLIARADHRLVIVPPDVCPRPKITAGIFTLQKLAKLLSGSHWIKSDFWDFVVPFLFT